MRSNATLLEETHCCQLEIDGSHDKDEGKCTKKRQDKGGSTTVVQKQSGGGIHTRMEKHGMQTACRGR